MSLFVQRILHYFRRSLFRRRSRTVRYAFPVLLTTFSLVGAALILPDDASYVRIESNKQFVDVEQQFSVDVYVGAHVPVNAVNIALEFPEELVEVRGIDVGRSVITIWTQDPYVENNKVVFSGGTFRNGFLGEHLIGTVDFSTKERGTASFSAGEVSFFAGDGSGTTVNVGDSGAESLVVLVDTDDGTVTAGVAIITRTDINDDGNVSMADILAFMDAWRTRSVAYDFNGDNRMTFRDFGIILAESFQN